MAKSSNKKAIIAVGAVVVVAGLTVAAAIGSEGFKNKNFKSWFNNWGKGGTEIVAPEEPGTAQDGIMLLSSTIAANDYAAYGVSEQALSAKTLTAEFTPANATDKRVNWNIRWKNSMSSWAKGKLVTSYVAFTPGANYAPTATVSVLQAFGEPVVISCTSRANSSLTDNCTVHYVGRIGDADYTISFGDSNPTNPFESTGEFSENFDESEVSGAYTVLPDSFKIQTHIQLTDELYEYMQPKVSDLNSYFDITMNSISEASVSWQHIYSELNSFDYKIAADYFLQSSTNIFGYYESTVECYYNGELIYTFTRTGDLTFDDCFIAAMSIPATNITLTDKVIPF